MAKRSPKTICSFLFLCILFQLKTIAQPPAAAKQIQELINNKEAVGIAVAVVKNNQLIYTNSFGLKDVEKKEMLGNKDIFRIASISKSFSATAIMQLVEKGKLSLKDDVSDLVGFKIRNPKFPETVITLEMLLSHHSSINDKEGYFTLDAINPAKNANWQNCYNDYEPGKGYMYCNLNFNMAGTIIERFSGERFDQYIKHHVLDPLGLYGGYCIDSLDSSRFATIYEYDGKEKKYNPSPGAYASRSEEIRNYTMGYSTPVFSPTGGMKISATDLAKYMMMHMNYGKHNGKRIIKRKSARRMQAPFSEKAKYGLAIVTSGQLIAGKILKGHTGSAYGLHSAMFFDPQKKYGIVVIINGCLPDYAESFNTVIRKTANYLYEGFIK